MKTQGKEGNIVREGSEDKNSSLTSLVCYAERQLLWSQVGDQLGGGGGGGMTNTYMYYLFPWTPTKEYTIKGPMEKGQP